MPQFDNHLFKYIETKSFIFFNLMYFCVICLNAQRFNVFQRFEKKPSQFLVLDFIYFSLFVYFIIILTDLLYFILYFILYYIFRLYKLGITYGYILPPGGA